MTTQPDSAVLASSLKAKFERVASTTLNVLPKPTAPNKYGWSDQKLEEMKRDLFWGNARTTRTELQKILARFYYLYLAGKIQEGDNLVAIVCDAATLARSQDGFVWSNEELVLKSFYNANTSNTTSLSEMREGALKNLIPAVALTDQQRKAQEAIIKVYEKENMTDFKTLVSNIIDSMDTTGAATDDEIKLHGLTGFLALTLFRFATKDVSQMSLAFSKTQYTTNLGALVGWSTEMFFSPPCNECLEKCQGALIKGLESTSRIFTIIVHKLYSTQAKQTQLQASGDILAASVLTHTARNGLGLVQMLDAVYTITKLPWKEVAKYTFRNETAQSWNTLRDFYDSQTSTKNPQYSVHWARVIDHGYFRGLAPKENKFLATILAAIIAEVQGDGVWQAEWAKTSALSDDAKFMGKVIYLRTKKTIENEQGEHYTNSIIAETKLMMRATGINTDEARAALLEEF